MYPQTKFHGSSSLRGFFHIGLAVLSLIFFWTCTDGFCDAPPTCQILPSELIEAIKNKGLTPIENFYKNRPGMLNPPYVYGFLPGDAYKSAVVWSMNREKKRYYLLILSRKNPADSFTCIDSLEWNNYPGGLSVLNDSNINLNSFRFYENPKNKFKEDIKMINTAIKSEYDGVQTIFYNHKGVWLFRTRH